jgi:hypothetical protein
MGDTPVCEDGRIFFKVFMGLKKRMGNAFRLTKQQKNEFYSYFCGFTY